MDRAISADPLCEDLQRVALELEGELGRFPKAEKRFQDYSALLNEELGVYPQRETQELMRKLEKQAGIDHRASIRT